MKHLNLYLYIKGINIQYDRKIFITYFIVSSFYWNGCESWPLCLWLTWNILVGLWLIIETWTSKGNSSHESKAFKIYIWRYFSYSELFININGKINVYFTSLKLFALGFFFFLLSIAFFSSCSAFVCMQKKSSEMFAVGLQCERHAL